MPNLGKYEIRGTLGRGAMGTVYDGWDPVIDRRVAIKTIGLPQADDPDTVEGLVRFRREVKAAGRLIHPNIVGVFDYGETDDVAYIVMEFVDGQTLKDMLSGQGRLAAATAVAIMEDVLAGLAFSHGRGVVHRDIKPANIMVTPEGHAKIADFGIARIEQSELTQAGTVMGTPAYMSPEQFRGQVVDQRTDIYSCGVMLYQLLTGDRPFEGSMTSIMHKALTVTPPRPSELDVTSPLALDGVVAKAMARRPDDRFANATEFAEALLIPSLHAESVALPSDHTFVMSSREAAEQASLETLPPRRAAKRRSKLPLLLGGAGAIAAAAAVMVWVFMPTTEPAHLQQASVRPPERPQTPLSPAPVSGATPPSTGSAAAVPPGAEHVGTPIPPRPEPPRVMPTPQQSASIAPPPPNTPIARPEPQATARPTPPSAAETVFRPVYPPPRSATTLVPTEAPASLAAPPRPAPQQFASVAPAPPRVAPPPVPRPNPPDQFQAAVESPRAQTPLPATDTPAMTAQPAPPPVQTPPETVFRPVSSPSRPPTSAMPTEAPVAPAPTTTPAPQQFASVTLSPPPVQPPVAPAASVEAALVGTLPTIACSLVRAAVGADGSVAVDGVAGAGQPREAVQNAVNTAHPTRSSGQVQAFEGPYCAALDTLRSDETSGRIQAVDIVQAGGSVGLHDNDVIGLQITMPAFSGYLHVMYLQHDATVFPLVPGPGYVSQSYAARSRVDFGNPRPDFEGWRVGPPFGVDMIIAVATTAPLFARPLPDSQPIGAYLTSLQAAMEALRHRGGSVSAAAVILDTLPPR